MDQYQQKINNYIKQSIIEIYNHGVEYHNDDDMENDIKISAHKKYYINNIESSLKKLLNNTESIFSHSKFELINNSSVSEKTGTFNSVGILDMDDCMESDYDSNNGDDNEISQEDNEIDTFNGTDSVKANRYIDGDNNDNEEDGNIFYDNTVEDTEDDNTETDDTLDGCWVRQKRKEKKLAENDTPSQYFKDEDGYVYGQHCGRELFKDNLCETHFIKKGERGEIELVTDYPLKYENTQGKNDLTDTDSEKSFTKSKTQEYITVIIKKKKYLVDESNGHIFDCETMKFLGKRVKSDKKNRKFDYIFNT